MGKHQPKLAEPNEIFGDLKLKKCKFVEEYIKDCNGARAAVAAGYADHPGTPQRILRDPKVKAAIAKLRANSVKCADFTLEKSIEEADNFIKISVEKNQMIAAAKFFEIKNRVTGLWQENINLRADKPLFNLTIGGLDTPAQLPPAIKTINALPLKRTKEDSEDDDNGATE